LRLPSTSLTVADPDRIIMIRRPTGHEWIGRPIPEERQTHQCLDGFLRPA
jgi:hypothetical protein